MAIAVEHTSNMFVNRISFCVGVLCYQKVIGNVDIKQKVINELVTAWREGNGTVLGIASQKCLIYGTNFVKRILLRNLVQKDKE